MTFKEKVITTVVVLVFGALIWSGPLIKEYFGTRYADADRGIFEHGQSHVLGTVQGLNQLKMDYDLADSDNHRIVIKRMAIQEASTVEASQLPQNIRLWLNL